MPRRLWLALCFLCTCATSIDAQCFRPGTLPIDTNGAPVHAHGGGIIRVNSTYYWYGTTQKQLPGWISEGINLYSSSDLLSWTFEGAILHSRDILDFPFPPPYRIERPSVLYNRRTSKFVLLFHLDTPAFQYPAVGVAQSPSLKGPYAWVNTFKPDGRDSFDMTAYEDKDGHGYLVRSVQNAFLGISRLDNVFHDTRGLCSAGPRAEAPAVFQPMQGTFFVLGSHLTGWDANPAILLEARAASLCEAKAWFQSAPAVGPGSDTTFQSQAAAVFQYIYEDGTPLFVYMGDRWNAYGPGSVASASYVWLPLLPTIDGSYELRWFATWSFEEVKPYLAAPQWTWGKAASACWRRGWRGCARSAAAGLMALQAQLTSCASAIRAARSTTVANFDKVE